MVTYSSISFLDRFMSLVVGLFVKFSLWSLKVTKELPETFISMLSNISVCFEKLIPSLLICVSMFLFGFFISCCNGIFQKVLTVLLIQSLPIECLICGSYTPFYKQLGSGTILQSCLHFQGFQSSKLLNG